MSKEQLTAEQLLEQMAGAGMDTLREGSQSIPLLKILQGSSAEVSPKHKNYDTKKIEGAKEGDIVLTSEGRVMPQPLEVLVLAGRILYAEWRPRNKGGGMVGHHPLSIVADKAYRRGGPKSEYEEFLGENELQMTYYFAVLFNDVAQATWKHGIIAMTGGQLKVARAWHKRLSGFVYPPEMGLRIQPPMFARVWKLSTKVSQGGDDSSFMAWSVDGGVILDPKNTEHAGMLSECVQILEETKKSLPGPGEGRYAYLEETSSDAFTESPEEDDGDAF